MGCVLAECNDDGIKHPVEYANLKLSSTQCAWSVIEHEAFAIVWALGRFRNVIFCSHITVLTDHNPLSYLCNSALKSAKLTRWALALQKYDLSLRYTRGSCNTVADYLSRCNNTL